MKSFFNRLWFILISPLLIVVLIAGLRQLPLSCLLVETDSPVLGPDPQQRNEPANAAICLEAIAQIKGVSPESATQAAYENTCRLYGI